jgi:DNA-binding transcriptional regulator YdaS (Cro superfamily)
MVNMKHLIQKAIDLIGTQAALGVKAGVSQQHISRLLGERQRITAETAIRIERATDGAVSRHDLRPDLYPRDEPAPLRTEQPVA